MVEFGNDSDEDDEEEDSEDESSEEDEATPKKVNGFSSVKLLAFQICEVLYYVSLFILCSTSHPDPIFLSIKAEAGKKRPIESAMKTPVMEKKVKLVAKSGQKSGGLTL